MKISVDSIKELRNLTSASVMDCKKALQDSSGDMKKAIELLRTRGLEIAASKKDRAAKDGRVEAYVHLGNKIGVLLEVDCETDFVARSPDFCKFTKDVAMQIAACNPLYLKQEDVPKTEVAHVHNQAEFYTQSCLLEQVFIKDPSLTIKDYLASLVVKIGENIIIRRFVRYKVGE